MAVALNQQGAYEWEEFRGRLINEVGRQVDDEYYASWLGAFERLMLEKGVLSYDELARRRAEYVSMERTEVF
jgi:nitrile hydratase accessory protein